MGKEIACSAKERDVYVRSVGLFFKKNLLAKRIFFEVSGCGGFPNCGEIDNGQGAFGWMQDRTLCRRWRGLHCKLGEI